MEAALLSCFITTVLTKLSSLAEDQYKLVHGMKSDMESLQKELKCILSIIDGRRTLGRDTIKKIHKISMEDLLKHAHKIEDCIDGLMYHAVRERKLSHRLFQLLRSQYNLRKQAEELKRLVSMAAEDHKRSNIYGSYENLLQDTPSISSRNSSCHQLLLDANSDLHEAAEAADADPPVGIDAAVNELVEHLAEEPVGKPKELKVISIVGFPGSGKTVLARALYNSEAGQKFGLRAWVRAAQWEAQDVLMMILNNHGGTQALRRHSGDAYQQQPIVDLVRKHLENKRYLIVIDDMQRDQWEEIKRAFPCHDRFSSRIIVTTTLHPVAKALDFSNVSVHIHKMARLDNDESEKLFVKHACLSTHSDYDHPDSKRILEKCDGQALALVNVGRFLRKKGWPTEERCNGVCRRLRHHLLESEDLKEMREKLINSYDSLLINSNDSLPSHAPKACLMHFGMFPGHHPLRRKSLLRLWLAEGFLRAQPSCGALEVAEEQFDTLIDRSIIESIHVGNNTKVKTCSTYGMMREFILVNSMSQGSIALLGNDSLHTQPSCVRRLSFYDSSATDDRRILDGDLTVVRSLSIHGKASEAILDFSRYRFLRVLNLEGCSAKLGVDHLKRVCDLLLLKYLSLGTGSTVDSLPKEIRKLKLLETLDLRKSKVRALPIEAFLLPNLVHLFGEFHGPHKVKRSTEVLEFLSEKSNMQTLVGFTTDGSDAFAEIMSLMTKLNKVKILCDRTKSSGSFTKLKDAIQKFILDKQDGSNEPRSLSLKFILGKQDEVSQECYESYENLLNSLTDPCGQYLTSFKLQGKLTRLPQFVLSLNGLTELCLESAELPADLLAALGGMQKLKYLKLIACHLGNFIINSQSLRKLLRLCLVLKCPTTTLPIFEEGAMKFLVSLLVICKGLVGLSGMRIQYLQSLTDITLHPGVLAETKEEWENAAKQHPKRPQILLLRKDDPDARERFEDTVVSDPAETVSTNYSSASDGQAHGSETEMLLNPGPGVGCSSAATSDPAEESLSTNYSTAPDGLALEIESETQMLLNPGVACSSSASARYGDVSSIPLTELHTSGDGLEPS